MEFSPASAEVETKFGSDFVLIIKYGASKFQLIISHKDLEKENLKKFIETVRIGDVADLKLKDRFLEISTMMNEVSFSFDGSESANSIMYSVPNSLVLPCFEKMLECFP